MLKNIESNIQSQITFGVLALNRMVERKALDDALAQDTLSEVHETLNTALRPEHRDILTFIFRNLFAAEKTHREFEKHWTPSMTSTCLIL